MAYNGSFLWVRATTADQTAYANTGRLKTINSIVYLSFPMAYVARGGYKSTPNAREEIKAYRDDNTRNLTRVTATGTKTSITISMLGGLNNAKKSEVLKWFTDHESNQLQRKVPILFYDMDTGNYVSGDFYRADTEYSVLYVNGSDVIWDAFTIELVQY